MSLSNNLFSVAQERLHLTLGELAIKLNTSLYALSRWERGDLEPPVDILKRLHSLLHGFDNKDDDCSPHTSNNLFASRGSKASISELPLFRLQQIAMRRNPRESLLEELYTGSLWNNGALKLGSLLERHAEPARSLKEALSGGISAGKNTYTYDAHTYHTKVPPQGIAEIIRAYLPDGGLLLDPFAGSGMTGVAAMATGNDVILNELSPAASFIAYHFTKTIDPVLFSAAVNTVCAQLTGLRRDLYTTTCRKCHNHTELLYTVWSYKVACTNCHQTFVLWDHCRKYGQTVREHKLLGAFPCPSCGLTIKKSRLPRFDSVPVLVGYKCCSTTQVEHAPDKRDLARIKKAKIIAARYRALAPRNELPDGVNLCQPKRHGLTTIDAFYTPRNLAACAALWQEIRRIEDPDLAAAVGFVFTSLYQRVTRLSEYRFWGGSGNTAHFNVPYISNEANVFVTFLRKAKTIADHFSTTATHYTGTAVINTGSATTMPFLPDNSIDFIFTDPPFGANINYSEMNILWESWLGAHTEPEQEAIVNRYQGKGVDEYQGLMRESFQESYRVLRDGHWMVVVFMNSSETVWNAIYAAITESGFSIEKIDIFDKQHGTFKQFVSVNTAGSDLIIHCRKDSRNHNKPTTISLCANVADFIERQASKIPIMPFIHVNRDTEIDFRTLYSRYLSFALTNKCGVCDFAKFRSEADTLLGVKS